jgi:2,3-bisphosphoglycerate-independent phosphoglycerate mutase
MMTFDLIHRGLDFDRAYATANRLRDRLRDRGEVTTHELRNLIEQELADLFGTEVAEALREPVEPDVDLWVLYHGEKQPFSRGVLARSILAAGLDLDRAYRVVSELYGHLKEEEETVLSSEEIVRRVAALLERIEGSDAALRYRLVRRIPRLPRPLVLYIGGASGTGKSTLALELAPLLRIYRINSTDTIRQVMRTVFSPAALPALYRSSFEPLPPVTAFHDETTAGPGATAEISQRLSATFEDQTTRVLVGVRAVVERAITENMSIVVEGVHLYPPLIPFPDLEGAVYQVPLVLGTLDEEAHRSRFLTRARLGGRRAERYVENFFAIRSVHDWILDRTESYDVPMLDTSDPELPVGRSLRLITRVLERKIPALATDALELQRERSPVLVVVIDGLADRPVRALGGRTPLQAASTPALDQLAAEGRCGLADPVAPGVVPDTAAGSLALFGQSPLALKRGPVEAMGAGFKLSPSDIALRGNFATVDGSGNVIDRRAGRIREETAILAAALDRLPLPGSLADEIEVRVRSGTEHRFALALRGEGLSSAIQGSDPGDGAAVGPPLTPSPVDPTDPKAVHTARVLALFEREARGVLADHPLNRTRQARGEPPANAVLTRGAGRIHRLVPLEEAGFPLRLTCIAGDHTILGLASWLGADTITSPKMTANLDTELEAKFEAARRALKSSDLVVLHLKGADIASHDQRPDLKVAFLEQIDLHLKRLLDQHSGALRVAVASDHATLSESGQHAADPLPVLIWEKGTSGDKVERFDEHSVGGGELQRFPLQMLLGMLFNLR